MASLNQRLRRRFGRLRDDKGAELIEFAIVFPIFMVVVAAMLDFGFLFQRYEVVTNAAREGARLGVLKGQGYTVADVQTRVHNYLNAAGLNSGSATTDVTYDTETLPSGLTIQVVKVMVQYPSSFVLMAPFAGLIGGSAPGSITLKAASVMRVEAGGS